MVHMHSVRQLQRPKWPNCSYNLQRLLNPLRHNAQRLSLIRVVDLCAVHETRESGIASAMCPGMQQGAPVKLRCWCYELACRLHIARAVPQLPRQTLP